MLFYSTWLASGQIVVYISWPEPYSNTSIHNYDLACFAPITQAYINHINHVSNLIITIDICQIIICIILTAGYLRFVRFCVLSNSSPCYWLCFLNIESTVDVQWWHSNARTLRIYVSRYNIVPKLPTLPKFMLSRHLKESKDPDSTISKAMHI